jgi:hypothetical protein
VSRAAPPPDGFGRAYRRAVFARTSTKRALTLAWVLVDEAYAHRSLVIEIGYRLLRRETGLTGWKLEAARNDLVDAGLLSVRSSGSGRGARTEWTLRWNKNVRSWGDVPDDEKQREERPPNRPPKHPPKSPLTRGHASASASKDPLKPPCEGGRVKKNF